MNITQQELDGLRSSKSESEWNAACDEVKKARNGQYPPDWWPIVIVSGLLHRTQASWK